MGTLADVDISFNGLPKSTKEAYHVSYQLNPREIIKSPVKKIDLLGTAVALSVFTIQTRKKSSRAL